MPQRARAGGLTLPGLEIAPPVRPRRTRDGLTAEERERPVPQADDLLRLERAYADDEPEQLALFAPGPGGGFTPLLGGLTPLEPSSSLELARAWYRRELEQAKRPRNTIESYSYDLAALERKIGPKPIDAIDRRDIANFLQDAEGRSTRKRHLTSLRRFFRFLIDDARVLRSDPTEGFYPHAIPLRTPIPLFAEERAALLAAAAGDEPWSLPAIWLMLNLGLGRAELLALRPDHIDLADPERPVVYVFYDDAAKRGKERKLAADAEFGRLYAAYLDAAAPPDLLFPYGPASVNAMVDRVREAAGITKAVTPQTLRHSFAVERAFAGATEDDLLAVLGLADDPRNRASVRRYLKLAEPPM
jgi:integrase/recombinase XerD